MGGNDLNLKKSWHPQLMTNQRRVYDAEQAALQERKATEARIEEIRRERQIEETQKQLEAAGGPKRVNRVEWMYQGPNDGGRDEYSSEAFLLGKRRIDSILRGDDSKQVEKTAGPEAAGPAPIVASARDTAAKIREDPLVAIKRQEQEAYQAMMKDPSKRRQLLAQMGIAEEKPVKDKERKHRSHRHRSHRHRGDDDDRRHRDYSRERSYSPKRRYDDSDYERERKRRRRSDSRDGTRDRRRRGSDERHDQRDGTQDERSRSPSRRHALNERREKRDGSRKERARSPRRRYDSDERRARRDDNQRDRSRSPVRRYDSRDRRQGRPNGRSERAPVANDAEERARKLAAMQDAATDLDRVREERLAALAEKEQAERKADDEARAKSQKYGGRDFSNKLHNSAGNESLADRIGRGRQGLQRDDD
ncbi:RNA-splicing factor [Gnomoniopsis smithogilvyi]|uniref:RNA-splicing factor n=1 Tax=Gnomoniopsis smithogilvyi TaxID=1191159 RepID=A0A9W9CTE4_9PEZI|nr:RNA-splicing factor [Gnomoniopsis smithogilvyi]